MSLKFKGLVVKGSTVPDGVYQVQKVSLGSHIKHKYLPAAERVLKDQPLGLKLLLIIMADTEGYYPGSRSYDTNNPGNIGNNDAGKNVRYKTIEEGIEKQLSEIIEVVEGRDKYFRLGKEMNLQWGFSEEMEKNKRRYQVESGFYPGYKFVFTGQIDQYVKIYATLPRVNNVYVNRIVSWFHQNGFTHVTPESKIQDLVKLTEHDLPEKQPPPVDKVVDTPRMTGVNLRSGPGVTFSKIIGIKEGVKVTVFREQDGWSKVLASGREGWINSDYLK